MLVCISLNLHLVDTVGLGVVKLCLLDLCIVARLQTFQFLHTLVVFYGGGVGAGGVREDEAAGVDILGEVVLAEDVDEVLVALDVGVEALPDLVNAVLHV